MIVPRRVIDGVWKVWFSFGKQTCFEGALVTVKELGMIFCEHFPRISGFP